MTIAVRHPIEWELGAIARDVLDVSRIWPPNPYPPESWAANQWDVGWRHETAEIKAGR